MGKYSKLIKEAVPNNFDELLPDAVAAVMEEEEMSVLEQEVRDNVMNAVTMNKIKAFVSKGIELGLKAAI